MRRYVQLFFIFFSQAIKTELAYRSQVLQRFLGVMAWFSATIFFWMSAGKQAGLSAYTPDMILFYFVVVCFHDFLFISGDEFTKKIGESIRAGKLSASLVQPFPYLLKIFATGCGGICLRIWIVVPIFLLLRLTLLREVSLGVGVHQVGFYLLALMFASIIALLCLIITSLFAFDMTRVWAPWIIFVAFYNLLSGVFFPADLATGFVKLVMEYLPFYYMAGFPALILLGRVGVPEVMHGFVMGVFIIAYLTLILTLMWRRGIKKFEAIGI